MKPANGPLLNLTDKELIQKLSRKLQAMSFMVKLQHEEIKKLRQRLKEDDSRTQKCANN
jgi:hypothetical protein